MTAMPNRPSTVALRQRLTAAAIQGLVERLPERERTLLTELARLRLATTQQLARLVAGGLAADSAMRLTRRHLQRLKLSGLVRRFPNRSRDRRTGAPGYVWALTAGGLRATGGGSGSGTRQRKAYRPSEAFVDHRLGITELGVRLVEQARTGGPAVREFAAEPDSWRVATGPAGQRLVVKPDALARLAVNGTEVSWFVEIDNGSQSATVIAGKCRVYRTYELAGIEQQRHGVFPGVLFVVPNAARARQIERVIAQQPTTDQELFAVATEDEAAMVMARLEDVA